jgi:peptidoglycan/xylan/chitin deacetylase (PgdA/CDA1 family)
MHDDGISFGAHTVSHPILTRVPLERAVFEIRESKSQIERQISQELEFLAYPNGDFDSAIANVVEQCGFRGAVSVEPKWITAGADKFGLGRFEVYCDDVDIFKIVLSGIPRVGNSFSWIRNAVALL